MKSSKQQWEAFEEHAKVAFVENPHGTRLLIKTSAGASGRRVAARVTTHRRTAKELTHHTSAFETALPTSTTTALSRVLRLLRFAMQEVLGPMKAASTAAPTSPRQLKGTDEGKSSATQSSATTKPKKKNKKKNTTKKG
ncbi:hypothetical protein PINS_up007243 [Pythium insidiosum]|nr:hypothetical protein PINS_up007243 [Pythium insidiosum]